MKKSDLLLYTCSATALINADIALASSELTPVSIKLAFANEYHDDLRLDEYWYSEKLDGIRAVWTGSELQTRTGNTIHAPAWFTESLPNEALDGELWAGRNQFQFVQRTVMDSKPSADWQHIVFMVFDRPNSSQDFEQRYQWLQDKIAPIDSPYLAVVDHHPLNSDKQLQALLSSIEAKSGEGIMLRHRFSQYQSGRTDDLIKVKSYQDSEAVVMGYKPGNGKYDGLTGSLLVKWMNGKTFYLGSGLSDEERQNPPPIGSKVNFKYNGLTQSGLPRFARFSHIRAE
ncbi:DNA ligase [Vibrio gangliei]|uniref:DNA ligase n=1 Tax=Vibrio gangliei TaxID=2077090 RepID=UPI000D016B75|nr:DNA ligase [Vibrio gangliei]